MISVKVALAVAVAEMAFGGNVGVEVDLQKVAQTMFIDAWTSLFAESNTRFLCEVKPENAAKFEATLAQLPIACVGKTVDSGTMKVTFESQELIELPLEQLKQTWLAPLNWS